MFIVIIVIFALFVGIWFGRRNKSIGSGISTGLLACALSVIVFCFIGCFVECNINPNDYILKGTTTYNLIDSEFSVQEKFSGKGAFYYSYVEDSATEIVSDSSRTIIVPSDKNKIEKRVYSLGSDFKVWFVFDEKIVYVIYTDNVSNVLLGGNNNG